MISSKFNANFWILNSRLSSSSLGIGIDLSPKRFFRWKPNWATWLPKHKHRCSKTLSYILFIQVPSSEECKSGWSGEMAGTLGVGLSGRWKNSSSVLGAKHSSFLASSAWSFDRDLNLGGDFPQWESRDVGRGHRAPKDACK